MSIWACHTGAGEAGSDLLFAMAKRLGKPVRAGTGYLYVNSARGLWWENGTQMQIATPTNRPVAIMAPSVHPLTKRGLWFQLGDQVYDTSQITGAVYEEFPYFLKTPKKGFKITAKNPSQLMEKVFVSDALDMKDTYAMGTLTGQLELTFKNGGMIKFNVINRGLAIDRKSDSGYYLSDGIKTYFAIFDSEDKRSFKESSSFLKNDNQGHISQAKPTITITDSNIQIIHRIEGGGTINNTTLDGTGGTFALQPGSNRVPPGTYKHSVIGTVTVYTGGPASAIYSEVYYR